MTSTDYHDEPWWKDTMQWIKQIPKELDTKKGSAPLKAWMVFESHTWDAAWSAASAAASAAARDAERRWQERRLWAYLTGKVRL